MSDTVRPVRFLVLGSVEVVAGDGRLLRLKRRHERALLAIFLLAPDRTVSMQRLCELMWEDHPPERPYQAIRSYVSRLRRLLAEADAQRHGVALVAENGGYRMTVAPDSVDALAFRALLDCAGQTTDLSERDRLLRESLALWRGPALHNIAPEGLRQRLAVELEELRLRAVEESLATGLALGRDRDLLPELARLSAEQPVRERVIEMHMLALYRQGRPAEALDVYRDARARLAEELGLDPGPALQQLHHAVLRGDPLLAERTTPKQSSASPGLTPALLPADLPGFAGRVEHLHRLDALLARSARAMVISAIAGTPGVGKTALAVHWAHRVRAQFPDGQLYANLYGFDPHGAPARPADVIRRFLDALRVPAHRIPAGIDAQADLYRSLLADKRILILLDNASDPDQVRPLLPGASGCLTLVTSRNRLTGLVAVDGAQPLAVDLLTLEESRQLLATRLGADRVAAEPDAIDELIARCARLPLALAIAAAHIATRPDLSLPKLVAELANAATRFDTLTGDDNATDLRVVFSYSYDALGRDTARLLRLLSLHPGPDIDALAASSLAGISQQHTSPLLAELTRANLLTEPTPDRYAFHDLLRAYANEQAHTHDPETERHAAVHRVLDHYLHTAHDAATLLNPHSDPITSAPAEPSAVRTRFASHDQALTWFTIEHSVLIATVQYAAESGFDTHAWLLAATLEGFLERQGNWQQRETIDRAALLCARRLADQSAQAHAHRRLARVFTALHRYDDAHVHAQQALDLYTKLGDQAGQARTHRGLSWIYDRQHEPGRALTHAQRCLDLCRATGDRAGEAIALNNIGWDHAHLGDYHQSLTACQQALVMFEELADRHGQALTWDSIGYAHHHLGNHQQAISCYERALGLFRDLGDRHNEAATLANLGDSHDAAGNAVAAHQARQLAQAIQDDLA
jgi:DNA-binding SARP family transcriptional activator